MWRLKEGKIKVYWTKKIELYVFQLEFEDNKKKLNRF